MPVFEQGDESFANEFSIFACNTADVALGTDQSSNMDDMPVISGTILREDQNPRFAVSVDRSIRMRFSIAGSGTYTIFLNFNNVSLATNNESLVIDAGVLNVNGPTDMSGTTGTIASASLRGYTGGGDTFTVAWTIGSNPDSTGPSNEVVHHISVNGPSGSASDVTFLSFTGYRRTVGDSSNSRTQFGGSSVSLTDVMFCAKALPHGLLQRAYDSSPATETTQAISGPSLHNDTGIADAGTFFGPQALLAARHHTDAVWRTWSPLVNDRYQNPTLITVAAQTDATLDKVAAEIPGSSGHYVWLQFLRGCKVPRGSNRLFCRVHVQSYVSSGSAVPVVIRVLSSNRPQVTNGFFSYVEETVERNDSTTANEGSWVYFDLLPISREGDFTFLCLSVAIDPDGLSTNDANATVRINGWSVSPRVI